MFGRVAACGIAAFLLMAAAPSSGETGAFVDADAAVASVQIAITPALTQELQDQIPVPAENPSPVDPTAQVKVAALDPAEPTIKSPAVPGSPIRSPAVTEPFGLSATSVEGGDLLAKWHGVEADIHSEGEILARCRDSAETCPSVAKTFLAIIAQGRAVTGRARIGVINRAINMAIHPMSDQEQWGVPDRWSAPLDTLTSGLGDCEDYAIAKYVALREAGIAESDLRLIIVRNLAAGEDHAVAAARLDGTWIMLDNRWLTLVADNAMSRVIPLFVLDDDGVRQFAPAAKPRNAAAPASVGF